MHEFLNHTLFTFNSLQLKMYSVVKLLGFILCVFILLKVIKKSIYRVESFDGAKKYSIYTLLKYVILVIASIVSLRLIGFDLSILMAGSAALLVGLGLGIQNLFSDYISGIIILIDSSVKVGDVIEINGMICTVQEIQLRTTKVLTRDDKNIILPNTDLTRNQLINWSHSKSFARFEIAVGVDYGSDVLLVMEILKKVAINHPKTNKHPEPFVRFQNFGESSLDFLLFFWSEELFRIENIKSDMRIQIFKEFKKNNISIPFPQRVIHSK
ncbi:MAG: mechanosensitive ion channel [Sphingobacteriaceae bacterium]|nr:mechanosensitive ion channel [Sphingobacteriaceae bacterium]